MTTKTQKAIFDALINACDCSGGDGSVSLVTDKPEEAANAFEAYVTEIGDIRWRRCDHTSFFSGDQDGICFCSMDCKNNDVHEELTIIAPYFGLLGTI